MDVQSLKEYILDNEKLPEILQEIGCHSIHDHGGYITCGNKTGDNKSAIVIYLNENLTVVNYTRTMTSSKRTTDIFDLICYNEDYSFPEALKFCCNLFGLDYYQEPEEVPESLQILKMLQQMATEEEDFDDTPLKPIPEKILSYYLPYGNKMFEDDGISLDVQKEWGIGYDPQTNRITIPIKSSIGDLCAVKGRYYGEPDEYNPKYLYIEKNARNKLLYGLYENRKYITNSNTLFVFEAEKSVLQCASHGVRNCVALSGKSISKTQAEYIIRTGCTPIIALDKGVSEEEIFNIASSFPESISIYYIFDKDKIMDDKQSPSDNWSNWEVLIKNNIYKVR